MIYWQFGLIQSSLSISESNFSFQVSQEVLSLRWEKAWNLFYSQKSVKPKYFLWQSLTIMDRIENISSWTEFITFEVKTMAYFYSLLIFWPEEFSYFQSIFWNQRYNLLSTRVRSFNEKQAIIYEKIGEIIGPLEELGRPLRTLLIFIFLIRANKSSAQKKRHRIPLTIPLVGTKVLVRELLINTT